MNEITQCKTRVNNIIKVVMNVKYVNYAMTVCILLYGWKEIFSSKKSASSIKDFANTYEYRMAHFDLSHFTAM
jgi:hypothetical protein